MLLYIIAIFPIFRNNPTPLITKILITVMLIPCTLCKKNLHLDECLTSEGILCDTCAQFCPSEVKAITMIRRAPVLDRDRCVGCGLCVYYCESDRQPLTVEPLPANGSV